MKKCYTRTRYNLLGYVAAVVCVASLAYAIASSTGDYYDAEGFETAFQSTPFRPLLQGLNLIASVSPIPKKTNPRLIRILVVDTHLKKDSSNKTIMGFVNRLKSVFPAEYQTVFWSEYNSQLVGSKNYDLVVFSPQSTPWKNYPREQYNKLLGEIKNTKLPMIGICGGHQLIILANGGKIGPINPQSPSCKYTAGSYANCTREKGFIKISVANDPVFNGLNESAVVWLNHVEEVKELPNGFVRIAWNATTSVQAVRAINRKIIGFQFHPEHANLKHPDGEIIFRNSVESLIGVKAKLVPGR